MGNGRGLLDKRVDNCFGIYYTACSIMNNTSKGLPATSYNLAEHKTTNSKRKAKLRADLIAWSASQFGLGSRKKAARQEAKEITKQ